MLYKNSLGISHEIIKKIVKEGDIVVDATAGNGNDTLFLACLVGNAGVVYSFDIQEVAILNTKKRLEEAKVYDRVKLIHDGHENVDKYINKNVKAVMFNLGYLPKGDHGKATKGKTTIKSIEKCLELLQVDGVITIVIYYGGDSGFEEKDEIFSYIKNIDSKKYAVLVHEFVNQMNCPPIAVCIEKIC